jgi:hypothetical protein
MSSISAKISAPQMGVEWNVCSISLETIRAIHDVDMLPWMALGFPEMPQRNVYVFPMCSHVPSWNCVIMVADLPMYLQPPLPMLKEYQSVGDSMETPPY